MLRSAPRKIRRRDHYAFHNCQLCVTSIIPFCASRSHNNRGLKRFCFWQISRCHCYIADDLFYFDIRFRPDFFMCRVSPVAYILTGNVWWSCSWTMVDSSKSGTNLRDTMVGSSLSASRECDTEAQGPPASFFRCSLRSLHLSISDHKTSCNSTFFWWLSHLTPNPEIELRQEWTRGITLSIKPDK